MLISTILSKEAWCQLPELILHLHNRAALIVLRDYYEKADSEARGMSFKKTGAELATYFIASPRQSFPSLFQSTQPFVVLP
jgi:hypothetical protein